MESWITDVEYLMLQVVFDAQGVRKTGVRAFLLVPLDIRYQQGDWKDQHEEGNQVTGDGGNRSAEKQEDSVFSSSCMYGSYVDIRSAISWNERPSGYWFPDG